MRRVRSGLIAAAAGAVVLAAAAAQADIITENFTETVNPAATLTPTPTPNDFVGTSPAQFNPADGALTSASLSLTGSATWTSTSVAPLLVAIEQVSVLGQEVGFAESPFFTPGTIALSLSSGTIADPSALARFTGTGTVTTNLRVFDESAQVSTDTFATTTNGQLIPLTGTLTYTFTPAAVPEPPIGQGLPVLFAVGGLLAMLWGRRHAG